MTTKLVPFGGIALDPVELGINGNAILGIKESGKSYLGTELGEIFFDAGIPFVAFDPIGIWHNMRRPGRGKGYPVVVAGGYHGDIVLTPASAPRIVEAAMKEGISLVLDLFHPELSKADWRAIVRDCARLLLHKNSQYGLRHIFIEEAAEFVPQKVSDGLVYDAVERVIRMGGNSRLGCTLISPRSQEVNKAVLELCENLFLFRQRGKNALENLKKWLDIAGAASADVMRTLPTMPRGECWAWLGGSDLPVHVKVPPKSSFHPDRRAMGDAAPAPVGAAADVTTFIVALANALPVLEEQSKANDPKALKAEVARLTRELAAARRELDKPKPAPAPAPVPYDETATNAAIDEAERIGFDRGLQAARHAIAAIQYGAAAPPPDNRVEITPRAKRTLQAPIVADGSVPTGCAKALAVLAAVYPSGLTDAQWAITAGYKRTGGTWGTYKGRLKQAAMAEQRGDLWFATELGAGAVGDIETPPPPGPDLVRWWAAKIPGAPKIAEALIAAYPTPLSRGELADRVDMVATGGSFGTYLGRLAGPGLIDRDAGDDRRSIVLRSEVMA